MKNQGADFPNYQILISRFTSSSQWDRALETAREWLARDPENTRAHFTAAQALINLKRYSDAEPHLARVLAGNPENDTAHRFMSIVQFHQKKFSAADESIHKALSLDPNDAYHWYHLAWMAHKQGDAASAMKYAEKARQLSPRNPDVINLLALCTPNDPANNARILQQYHEALEIEPENPEVHNNIGVYRLDVEKNYATAEECFRRALFFDPSLKVARTNLFVALKHRDTVYRVLCWPKDFIFSIFAFIRERRRQSIWLYLLILPLWILAFRFVLGGLALWFMVVWPMVKAYEYLTIGDIRARAGEIGAKRGGVLGYRRWPLRLRLALFGALLISFWGGMAFLGRQNEVFNSGENGQAWLGFIIFAGLLILLAFWLRAKWRKGQIRFHTRRRTKQIDRLLEPETGKEE